MLAIVSGKGGCGKTTVTLGLAEALGTTERAVQVVDLDVELPDLHVLAGVERTPTLCSGDAGQSLQRAPGRPGVFVVPAPRLHETDAIESSVDELPARPTILDAPAGAGQDAIRPISIANAVFVVTTDDREAIEDAMKTAAFADALSTPLVGVGVRTDGRVPAGLAEQFGVPDEAVFVLPETAEDPLSSDRLRRQIHRIAQDIVSCRQIWEKGYTNR